MDQLLDISTEHNYVIHHLASGDFPKQQLLMELLTQLQCENGSIMPSTVILTKDDVMTEKLHFLINNKHKGRSSFPAQGFREDWFNDIFVQSFNSGETRILITNQDDLALDLNQVEHVINFDKAIPNLQYWQQFTEPLEAIKFHGTYNLGMIAY